jgi:ATP-binding cassette subfamily B protein
VAIVGRVGQGKTTLMRLLLHQIEPGHGHIVRRGVDLRNLTAATARQGIGYVPQDPVLISDTIYENIRFGRSEVSADAIARAVEQAQLLPDLGGFQQGLQTMVGPRGLQLSGGQKQRVSMARALAGQPSVLLLDDCTASLDADTEARLWDALRRERPELTIVVVTHRTAELERADEVVLLGDGGRILQRGRHGALMAQEGEYRTLYERWRGAEDNS